ncbi:hypothetical protein FOL47_004988 [Perkinsus chesapeaki]|uniref:MAPEG family protein n=1 Tax=Perkinsus chesapeaki TaxID=330153 RepID=A0A7J6M0L6_PERCH|nr:hypothetical protein FOL47_004988 [Perkinsus chesapeaki]
MSILAANGRLNMDAFSSAFIINFWAPSAVTVAWLVQCGMIDFICIGASRFYFKWGFPKGAEGAPEPLQRAMRAHINQLENTNHMLFTMWLCALCGRPNFAAGCGAVWVVLRHAYGMMYRMRKGDLKAIVRLTTPSYLIVHALYFSFGLRWDSSLPFLRLFCRIVLSVIALRLWRPFYRLSFSNRTENSRCGIRH